MYKLQNFVSMLTLATAKPTRRYFSVTAEQGKELLAFLDHVTDNAAGIALGGPADRLTGPAHIETIRQAAHRLAEIETASGFSWEKAAQDWETTCARIGEYIAEHGEAPTSEEITLSIQGAHA